MINSVLKRGYRAWRVFDNSLIIVNKYYSCRVKIETSPAKLVRVFGSPSFGDHMDGTTGYYDFEDQNLDLFRLADKYECKETININKLKLKIPPHHLRGKVEPFPTTDEFWASNKKYKFWLFHGFYADTESFTTWVKNKLHENVDIKQVCEEKYGKVQSYCQFDQDYELDRDYAIFKYNKMDWEK